MIMMKMLSSNPIMKIMSNQNKIILMDKDTYIQKDNGFKKWSIKQCKKINLNFMG